MTTTTSTKPIHSPRLMLPREVEEHLQLSATTIWRLVRDGKLTCLKIGSQKRFRIADVEAYLATCEIPQPKRFGSPVGHGGKKREDGATPSS